MNISYTPRGDYLLPNIRLKEPPPESIKSLGRYGLLRQKYLKEHRTVYYNQLLLSERLFPHLRETEELANARLTQVMTVLTSKNLLPDKTTDPMGWTAAMNALKAQADEMVLNELIYN